MSRWFLVLFGVVNFLFLATEKVALRLLSRWVRSRGFNFRTALIVGTGPEGRRSSPTSSRRTRTGASACVGYLDDDNGGEIAPERTAGPASGRSRTWSRSSAREVIDEVIFVIEKGKLGEYEEALLVAERHGVRAHVSLDIFPHVLARPGPRGARRDPAALLHDDAVQPGRSSSPSGRSTWRSSLVLFLVTLPIQLARGARDPAVLRRPVFFRQVRCGLNGRHFTLLKFRTMEPGAEERLSEISHLNEMTGPGLQGRRGTRA